jgi:hypothetical protein
MRYTHLRNLGTNVIDFTARTLTFYASFIQQPILDIHKEVSRTNHLFSKFNYTYFGHSFAYDIKVIISIPNITVNFKLIKIRLQST